MQKQWMAAPHDSLEYRVRFLYFLHYAFGDATPEVTRPCPCGISDTTVDKTELEINGTRTVSETEFGAALTDQQLPAVYLRHFLVLVLKLIQLQKLLKSYQLVSQENGRKSSRIEIQQLSQRSRKKGGAAIDDEVIRIKFLSGAISIAAGENRCYRVAEQHVWIAKLQCGRLAKQQVCVAEQLIG
ncbi:hypothetical protein ZIOFF_029713 [Zingiber officinale]|uniref:Uncharacterized protein n=1 Tax=Zingiber officinale TaxID=94328 RepID=A0A8J5GPX9_ZINOF|nr:hypothetical protein ZIOFF_029713 [Zingiber officinale]